MEIWGTSFKQLGVWWELKLRNMASLPPSIQNSKQNGLSCDSCFKVHHVHFSPNNSTLLIVGKKTINHINHLTNRIDSTELILKLNSEYKENHQYPPIIFHFSNQIKARFEASHPRSGSGKKDPSPPRSAPKPSRHPGRPHVAGRETWAVGTWLGEGTIPFLGIHGKTMGNSWNPWQNPAINWKWSFDWYRFVNMVLLDFSIFLIFCTFQNCWFWHTSSWWFQHVPPIAESLKVTSSGRNSAKRVEANLSQPAICSGRPVATFPERSGVLKVRMGNEYHENWPIQPFQSWS